VILVDKLSDRLDFVDKGMDLYNFYVAEQRRSIANEIIWIDNNKTNVENLRVYLSHFLGEKRISQLNDSSIVEIAVYRANYLYSQFQNSITEIDTKDLKLIVQILKSQGY
jgi:hypothetical protein